MQLAQKRKDIVRRFWIERARCLVAQQHLRLGCQRPRDRDTLLLSARKLRGVCVGLIGQPDKRQKLSGALFGFLPFHARQFERKADIP